MTADIIHFLPEISYPKPIDTTVLVGGCFDVLHYGHLNFLTSAKKLAPHLIVALEPDEKIHQHKKRPPIHTVAQRAAILAELRVVNSIYILPLLQDYEDYLNLVLQLQPDYLAVTEHDPQLENKRCQAIAASAELVIVNSTIELLSSSKIILAALD